MKKLMVLAVVLLSTIAASAAPVNILFQGFHGTGKQAWAFGFPYFASVNGGPTIEVMCNDWFHGGLPGQTWKAVFTDLGTGNLAYLRFNQLPSAPTLYKEVGWLLLETQSNPSQSTAINFAVWHIFDSNAPAPGILPGTPGWWVSQASAEATAGFPGVNFHQVGIYTPLNQYGLDNHGNPDPGKPQELMTIVPEPATLALLAGGLFGLWGRKRFL